MPCFYLDTAAVLKRYRTEPGSIVVDEIFDARTSIDALTTSRFTILEFTSVARRLFKGRVLKRAAYASLMARSLAELTSAVSFEPVTDVLIATAVQVAERYALRPGDALQLASALAVRIDRPTTRCVLVTSDRQLLEAARDAGLDLLDPESPVAPRVLRQLRAS